MRTDYCGNISADYIGQTVTIQGWVNKRRDLGGVIFLDMRDRAGIVQVVIDPDTADTFATANKVRNEYCLTLTGLVRAVLLLRLIMICVQARLKFLVKRSVS